MIKKERRKYAPKEIILSLILLSIAYICILIAGLEKPFGKLEVTAYIIEIIAVGLMIKFHMTRTGWIMAIIGFILIVLIKIYTIYHRGYILNKDE